MPWRSLAVAVVGAGASGSGRSGCTTARRCRTQWARSTRSGRAASGAGSATVSCSWFGALTLHGSTLSVLVLRQASRRSRISAPRGAIIVLRCRSVVAGRSLDAPVHRSVSIPSMSRSITGTPCRRSCCCRCSPACAVDFGGPARAGWPFADRGRGRRPCGVVVAAIARSWRGRWRSISVARRPGSRTGSSARTTRSADWLAARTPRGRQRRVLRDRPHRLSLAPSHRRPAGPRQSRCRAARGARGISCTPTAIIGPTTCCTTRRSFPTTSGGWSNEAWFEHEYRPVATLPSGRPDPIVVYRRIAQ